MRRSTLNKVVYTSLIALLVWVTERFDLEAISFVALSCIACFLICATLYKLDYLHPSTSFLFPWLLILIFSVIPISSHTRPVDPATYGLLLANMFAWMFGCTSASPAPRRSSTAKLASAPKFRRSFELTIDRGFIILYVFAAMNVLMAGYVPILSLITTGDSRYWEFGVPSVYGAFLAYANALACVALYTYLHTGKRKYLGWFVSVLLMHVAFVTRQNVATLLIEAFVIRSIALKRFSRFTMIWSLALFLVAFSALGTLRSGDIKEIIGVQDSYRWIPTSLVWVYAYSYFNALNIDNMITTSGAPFFDGYMWQTLLPSILRADVDHGTFLEISSMNVSSYIFPVYLDVGWGVVPWTFLVASITAITYRRALALSRFFDVATYGCLFFCAILSFFTNFWLYLPVIFQLFFFWIFQLIIFRPTRGASRSSI